jgi:hypothetical protein
LPSSCKVWSGNSAPECQQVRGRAPWACLPGLRGCEKTLAYGGRLQAPAAALRYVNTWRRSRDGARSLSDWQLPGSEEAVLELQARLE